MDRGAWWAAVHGVTQSWTQRRDSPHTQRGYTETAAKKSISDLLGNKDKN